MTESNPADFSELRQAMVQQIAMYVGLAGDRIGKETLDERVMTAVAKVPRHEFVPAEMRLLAYEDSPLPIGCGKTISQPFIVALMTDLLELRRDDKVLEVGTGLGYQAAVLAELVDQVYSVEIIEDLAEEADKRLRGHGYDNIAMRIGDGGQGWAEYAPFDKIIVTAAPELIPPTLLHQLKPGGRMVIPAGTETDQQLFLVEKDAAGKLATQEILSVLFSRLVTSH
jgi:protein-L-isoaspartate(D-aspartate) O-methyltransferase